MTNNKSIKTIAYLPTTILDKPLDIDQARLDIEKFSHDKDLFNLTFVEEKVFQKTVKDTLLPHILDGLSLGDNLIISKLSHLGKSALQIFEFLSLVAEKEVKLLLP